MRGKLGLGVAALGLMAGMALAEPQTERVFAHKHWSVDLVGFDDGTIACMAQVSNDDASESFSIWTYDDNSIRLQFYSTSWSFDGGTADLEVQIDRRTPWSLTDADLNENSVLFDLPDSDDSVRFVVEVAQGTRLHLRSASGQSVQSYSLAGSRASIQALVDCGDVLSSDRNPFN